MYDLAGSVKVAQVVNNSVLQKDLGCNIFRPCKFITQPSITQVHQLRRGAMPLRHFSYRTMTIYRYEWRGRTGKAILPTA